MSRSFWWDAPLKLDDRLAQLAAALPHQLKRIGKFVAIPSLDLAPRICLTRAMRRRKYQPKPLPVAVERVPVNSDPGRAWALLHRIAGVRPFAAQGHYVIPLPPSARLLALLAAPPVEQWIFLDETEHYRECAAWDAYLREEMLPCPRPALIRDHRGLGVGVRAPWQWPPSQSGKIYAVETLMTAVDWCLVAHNGL